MSYDDLKEMLMKKIDQELFNYKQNLIKNYTPEEIIEQAYKINIKQQIRDIVGGIIFSKEQLQVLLKTDNLLEKLYDKYEKSDGNIWEYLEDNVGDSLGNIVKEYNQLKNKNREKER